MLVLLCTVLLLAAIMRYGIVYHPDIIHGGIALVVYGLLFVLVNLLWMLPLALVFRFVWKKWK